MPNKKEDTSNKRPIYTDYLKERRKKKELMMTMTNTNEKRKDWTILLNNKKLSKKEKCEKIKEKAREIEEMALRKEQILNIKGSFIDNKGGSNSIPGMGSRDG